MALEPENTKLSDRFRSAAKVIRDQIRMKNSGMEYYPELLGTMLAFLKDNWEFFENEADLNLDVWDKLNELILRILLLVSKNSGLVRILKKCGWHRTHFEGSFQNFSTISTLKKDLTQLYHTQIWMNLAIKKRQGSRPVTPNRNVTNSSASSKSPMIPSNILDIFQEDRQFGAFCPNLLYHLINHPKCFLDDCVIGSSVSPAVKLALKKASVGGKHFFGDSADSQSSHFSTGASYQDSVGGRDKWLYKSLQFQGACLLADISGFTKLSAKFCEKGLGGLDDLHDAANVFLGKYVQIVYAYGGDVISFAGDALICVFYDKSSVIYSASPVKDTMFDCCMRAINCAIKLAEYFTDELSSHCGISCGSMNFANLGGYRHEWTYLLSGKVIPELGTCIDDASSKQVVISKGVHGVVKDFVAGEVLGSGNFLISGTPEKLIEPNVVMRFETLPNTPDVLKFMKRFVPKPVRSAISSGTLDTISELRPVTTVFLKLDSYDPALHENPTTLQPFFYMAQKVLHATGGFLRQFLIDDKGCVLIAMWGVPSFTYSNSATRAVAFALGVHQGTLALHHTCSIGITTGDVFCGNIGAMARRDFVGIGATVNLAARLMSKSKGKLYMDEKTHSFLPLNFRSGLEKSEGLTLKGYSQLMYAYICQGNETLELATTGTMKSTFVTRRISKELTKQLHKVLIQNPNDTVVDTGQSRAATISQKTLMLNEVLAPDSDSLCNVVCTVVEGKSGSGIEAVQAYFVQMATSARIPVFVISLRADDKRVNYGAFKKLFLSVVGEENFDDESKQREIINQLVYSSSWSDRQDKVAPFVKKKIIAKALGLDWNATSNDKKINKTIGNTQTDGFTPTEESKVLCEMLYVLLAQGTRAVLIEDAHCCDPLSWCILSGLVSVKLSLLIMIAARVSNMEFGSDMNITRNQPACSDLTVRVEEPKSSWWTDMVNFFRGFAGGKPNLSSNKVNPENQTNLMEAGATFTEFDRKKTAATTMDSLAAQAFSDEAHHNKSYYEIIGSPNTLRLELLPLSLAELRALVVEEFHADDDEWDDELLRLILKATSGNNFWCRESAQFIIERGLDEFLDFSGDPRSLLATLVVCRLEKLSLEFQVVLKTSAIFSTEFSPEMVKMSVPSRIAGSVGDALASLVDCNFIAQSCYLPPMYFHPNLVIKNILVDLIPQRYYLLCMLLLMYV